MKCFICLNKPQMCCIKQIQYFTAFYSLCCSGIRGFAQQSYNQWYRVYCSPSDPGLTWSVSDQRGQGKSINFSKWRWQNTQGLSLMWLLHFQSDLEHLHQIHGGAVQTENNTCYKDLFFFIQIKSTSQPVSHILDIPICSRSYLSVNAA